MIIRLMMLVIAVTMILAALVSGHAAAWYWLSGLFARPYAALIITAADLVVALIFLLLAARSTPGRVEQEARAVRQQVWNSALQSLTLSALLARLGARMMRSRN